MLEKFFIVERYGKAYRLVLKKDEDDFVIITYGTEYDCQAIKGAMLSILERLFNLKALL